MADDVFDEYLDNNPHCFLQIIGEDDSNITEGFWDAVCRTHNIMLRLKAEGEIIQCMAHNLTVIHKAIWKEAKATNTKCMLAVTTSALDHSVQLLFKIDLESTTDPQQEKSLIGAIPIYQHPSYIRWGKNPPKKPEKFEKIIAKASELSLIYIDDIEDEVRADNG